MLRSKAPKANRKPGLKAQKQQRNVTKKTVKKVTKRSIHTAPAMSLMQCFTRASTYRAVDLDKFHPDGPSIIGPTSSDWPTELVTPAPAQTTTLKNGIKIITQQGRTPVSHISLSVDMGSRYENSANGEQGLSHFMERSLLRSTTNRVTSSLVRDMAKLGSEITATSSRESFIISASTPTRINPVLGAIADLVKAPAYETVEVCQDLNEYESQTTQRLKHVRIVMDDMLHQAAFGNYGIGQSTYVPEMSLSTITPSKLLNWHNTFMVGSRMTLAATGVDHESFVRLADEMFGGIKRDTVQIDVEPTEYIGGQIRLQDAEYTGPTQLIFAWDAPSLKSSNLVAANVLQTIIGSGSVDSNKATGKGKFTRLHDNVYVNRPDLISTESFLTSYSDAGLLGIYAEVEPRGTLQVTEAILQEVAGLADTVTDEQVSRAKNTLKTNLLKHMAFGNNRTEEMARGTQIFGENKLPKLIDQIDTVTTKDVKTVAAQIFRNPEKPITVVTMGDASQLPRDIAIQ